MLKLACLLLKQNDPIINKCISDQITIIFNYLSKGRQLEKASNCIIKLFKSSQYMLKSHLKQYLELVTVTKNKFFFENSLKFIANNLQYNYVKNLNCASNVEVSLLESIEGLFQNCQTLGLVHTPTEEENIPKKSKCLLYSLSFFISHIQYWNDIF